MKVNITIGFNIPSTANDWELYSDMPGADKAAKALAKSVHNALMDFAKEVVMTPEIGMNPSEKTIGTILLKHAKKRVSPTLNKYSKFGACDSEGRNVAAQSLLDGAKLILGISGKLYQAGEILYYGI